jgi:hypothetical protein
MSVASWPLKPVTTTPDEAAAGMRLLVGIGG